MTGTVEATHLAGLDEVLHGLRTSAHRRRRRRLVTTTALTSLLVVLLLVTVTRGSSVPVAASDALLAAFGRGDGLSRFVVWENLLPRALTAVLAGALLGLSGVVYQRIVGNVLATPDIIGVSAGAATGGVVVLVGLGRSGVATQVGALLGAAAAVAVVLVLSSSRTSVVHRIVLMGIGVSACFTSATSYVLSRADEVGTDRAMRWLVGSLHGTGWQDVGVLAAVLAVTGGVLVLAAPDLETMRLGDDVAASVGTRVTPTRWAVLLCGAAMAALATSVVGPVAFVALVSGPIAIRLPAGGLVAAGLVGSIVLAGADLVAQVGPLVSPVPAGAITALVGAPALVVLLLRRRATV